MLVLYGTRGMLGMRRPQRRRPALAQIGEIGFARLDAIGQLRAQTSRRTTSTSIGMPTLRLERMVELTETRPTLSAS